MQAAQWQYPTLEEWNGMLRQHGPRVALALRDVAKNWSAAEPENAHLRELVKMTEQLVAELGIDGSDAS